MTTMITSSNSTTGSGDSGQNPSAGSGSASAPVDKDMFLKLLVAQLRNQDPLNPTDGTQFMAQLAQFQQLEQGINMGQDITAIRQDLDQLVPAGKSQTTKS